MSRLKIDPRFLSPGFWLWSAFWLALVALALQYIGERFLIGIDSQKTLCIGSERIYLIDRKSPLPWRGDIFAFTADERMAPYFKPGTIMVKYLAAVPGDRVVVDQEGVHVNGKLVVRGLQLAKKLKRPKTAFFADFIVPPERYFAVGIHPRSFDSRYWGLVRKDQILGIAHPIPYITEIIDYLFSLVPESKADEIDLGSLKQIRDRTRRIQENASEIVQIPENIHAREARKKAQESYASFRPLDRKTIKQALEAAGWDQDDREMLERAQNSIREMLSKAKQAPTIPSRRFHILVSTSLGRGRLREMFAAYAGRDDVVFEFQGLLEGQKIEDFMAQVLALIRGIEPQPNVTLDPLIFRKYGVKAVPVTLAEENGHLLGRVDGLVNVEWLAGKIESHRAELPFTAQYGQVVAIAERNLMDIIEERLAAIDWEEKKRQAMARFWKKRRFIDLPHATKNRTRLIDLRVRVPSDVFTPDGKRIARAGDVLNPLEKIPFRQALIVFDAASPVQTEWAANTIATVSENGLVPVLIATRLPDGEEWKTLQRIESETGLPLYLLPPAMRQRFEIEYTPSLIQPHDGKSLEIREVKLCENC